jgi:integrative and conjugative element protein (TIGR02256 family)
VENSVRHLVGTDKVGYAKVVATRAILWEHNPFVKVAALAWNITQMPLLEIMNHTVSVSCIGEDNTEAYLNENAVISGHTVYYIRALRGGKVGRIFRVIPGVDACIRCLELYRAEKKEFIPVAEDRALPVLFTECNNPVRAASAADLKVISSMASRLILDELQVGAGNENHWIWSTEDLPELKAYNLNRQYIRPHDRCTYCHHDKKVSVHIKSDCLEQIQGLVAASKGIETGGVLAGYVDVDGNVVVTNASGPGPKAKCSETCFQKDVVYCQSFLDELYREAAGQRVYLGEWHSHPNENNQPSARDLQSLNEISSEPNYLTEKPVMIIFSSSGIPSSTIHPMGKRFYHASLQTLNELS